MLKYIVFLFILIAIPFSLVSAESDHREQLEKRALFLREEISKLRVVLLDLYLQKEVSADSYVVANLSKGTILSKKNAEDQRIIASITKMMSAVVAAENIDIGEEIVLNGNMLTPYTRISPSLTVGTKVSAENLLKASLIQSTNYASEALTHFLEQGRFIELMNKKAEDLEMKSTVFHDAHGLSDMNRSTALDMIKFLDYIYKEHPTLLEITKDNNFWMPCAVSGMCKFMNLNNFYSHPDFIGGKTGYLHVAKQTFASLFNFNGDPLAVVLLHTDSRQKDTTAILERVQKTLNPPLSKL